MESVNFTNSGFFCCLTRLLPLGIALVYLGFGDRDNALGEVKKSAGFGLVFHLMLIGLVVISVPVRAVAPYGIVPKHYPNLCVSRDFPIDVAVADGAKNIDSDFLPFEFFKRLSKSASVLMWGKVGGNNNLLVFAYSSTNRSSPSLSRAFSLHQVISMNGLLPFGPMFVVAVNGYPVYAASHIIGRSLPGIFYADGIRVRIGVDFTARVVLVFRDNSEIGAQTSFGGLSAFINGLSHQSRLAHVDKRLKEAGNDLQDAHSNEGFCELRYNPIGIIVFLGITLLVGMALIVIGESSRIFITYIGWVIIGIGLAMTLLWGAT